MIVFFLVELRLNGFRNSKVYLVKVNTSNNDKENQILKSKNVHKEKQNISFRIATYQARIQNPVQHLRRSFCEYNQRLKNVESKAIDGNVDADI